jgi:RNA polymerase sigma-70 factor (ECF subfamily)
LPSEHKIQGNLAGRHFVALLEIDRKLLERCLAHKPRAWEEFIDRFLGLAVHVVNHTALARSVRLSPADRDDLIAEVFTGIIADDYAVLRHFRGESSLATYLTVIARRIVVREMLKQRTLATLSDAAGSLEGESSAPPFEQRIADRDEVAQLLLELDGKEAQAVRMYHLESKSYAEIGAAIHMPENSVGPLLSRARSKLRRANVG